MSEPGRLRVKLLAFGALTVVAVLTHMPGVTVAALASTCVAIPLATGLLGGTDLVRAVFLLRAPTEAGTTVRDSAINQGRSTSHVQDE